MGLRRRPGRLALAVFRLPLPVYRAGWGWLLGRTFLLLVHAGRRTGQPHAMTAMVLRYDAVTREAIICSGWGPTTDWILRCVPGVLPASPGTPSGNEARPWLGPALGRRDQGVRRDPPLRGVPVRTGIGTAPLTLTQAW